VAQRGSQRPADEIAHAVVDHAHAVGRMHAGHFGARQRVLVQRDEFAGEVGRFGQAAFQLAAVA
jgi:hypothetical protein